MNPTPTPVPAVAGSQAEAGSSGADRIAQADLVLAGRHVSTGGFLAGLMAAAELETVGRVDRLPRDLFPDADPVLAQEVWERACAVAWRAAGEYFASRQDPAVLEGLRGELDRAGFHAMAGLVGRSASVARAAGAVHPADGLLEREH